MPEAHFNWSVFLAKAFSVAQNETTIVAHFVRRSKSISWDASVWKPGVQEVIDLLIYIKHTEKKTAFWWLFKECLRWRSLCEKAWNRRAHWRFVIQLREDPPLKCYSLPSMFVGNVLLVLSPNCHMIGLWGWHFQGAVYVIKETSK